MSRVLAQELWDKASVSHAEPTDSLSGRDSLSTGISRLDRLLGGGFPSGNISELSGRLSSGKTSLLFATLSQATAGSRRVGYIDTFDTLDPVYMQEAGVDFQRFLWVRCLDSHPSKRVKRALKAADILARSNSFGVIVLDLETACGKMSRQNTVHIPMHCWFRLRKILRGKAVVLLVVARVPCSGSSAAVLLNLESASIRWKSMPGESAQAALKNHTRLLRGLSSQVHLLRGNRPGYVTIHCHL